MKKNLSLVLIGIFFLFGFTFKPTTKTLYDFKVTDIEGKEFDLTQLKGKKVMIVNTASECGFTPQYKELQELYTKYKDKNFVIVGFPANNFGGQEPGTNTEIKSFCSKNYGVTFPMMSKISVKGDDMAPIYKWLQNKTENGMGDGEVKWNFHKFLIDENGHWVSSIGSKTKPTSDEITKWIEGK
jgi:glutathione peroxidase